MSGFVWSDFLELAERLATGGEDALSEARRRTAVSRAYYAAFNICRERATRRGRLPTGSSRDHHDLLTWLAKQGHYVLARELGELREGRNLADYDHPASPDAGSWKDEAEYCLRMAERAMSDAVRLIP